MMKTAKPVYLKIGFMFFTLVCSTLVYLHSETLDYREDDGVPANCPLVDENKDKKASADEEADTLMTNVVSKQTKKLAPPSFLEGPMSRGGRIALVNVDAGRWPGAAVDGAVEEARFERVSSNLTWEKLFPEWIDEEEKYRPPSCPEIPMPVLGKQEEEIEVVVVELPPTGDNGGRDVFRLQVHLVAADVAARRGRRDERGRVKVLFHGDQAPMMEVFRCDDMVRREGNWWMYESEGRRLEEKVALPVGSCKLASPLIRTGALLSLPTYDPPTANQRKLEAYATVIHSSDQYVCGAITLAQSLRLTGTDRDLVLLHDAAVPADKLLALAAAGWKLRRITRIRNPHAEGKAYNAYNYSKLRLWQLLEYRKVVFVDADVLVLRNLDGLFRMPELSVAGNSRVIFNSGVMVIEPSECTFRCLMSRRQEIVPYNGGDQGFLNEIFVWWHRLPHRVNYMKNLWSNATEEVDMKERLFASDPPELYAIHYLGMKPWTCYRDYDCNWNVKYQRVFASDAANSRWWMVHDTMPEKLRPSCRLTQERKESLERHLKTARAQRFADGHWKRPISDERRWL